MPDALFANATDATIGLPAPAGIQFILSATAAAASATPTTTTTTVATRLSRCPILFITCRFFRCNSDIRTNNSIGFGPFPTETFDALFPAISLCCLFSEC